MATATELMKELKYIQSEINDIHNEDGTKSYSVVEKTIDEDGKPFYMPLYETYYDFAENRERIKELHEREREIKGALGRFNCATKVQGYGFTIAEGLVRIAELRGEIAAITAMVKKGEYYADPYRASMGLQKALYDVKAAKEVLASMQRELSALQVAIDKTNLTVEVK